MPNYVGCADKHALYWCCGQTPLADELIALHTGRRSCPRSKASVAVQMITSGLTAVRSTGGTAFVPMNLTYLARLYADLGGSMTPGDKAMTRRNRIEVADAQ